MKIEITAFIVTYSDSMYRFSDSIANSGRQDVGPYTWANAMDAMEAPSVWLCGDLDALRSHFWEYGAWERSELAAMSGQELNALLVQFIAGDYQERERAEDRGENMAKWDENHGGRLMTELHPNQMWCEDPTVTQWYYYVGM